MPICMFVPHSFAQQTAVTKANQGFIQGGRPGIPPPPPRISGLYYDISVDLMQVLGL